MNAEIGKLSDGSIQVNGVIGDREQSDQISDLITLAFENGCRIELMIYPRPEVKAVTGPGHNAQLKISGLKLDESDDGP